MLRIFRPNIEKLANKGKWRRLLALVADQEYSAEAHKALQKVDPELFQQELAEAFRVAAKWDFNYDLRHFQHAVKEKLLGFLSDGFPDNQIEHVYAVIGSSPDFLTHYFAKACKSMSFDRQTALLDGLLSARTAGSDGASSLARWAVDAEHSNASAICKALYAQADGFEQPECLIALSRVDNLAAVRIAVETVDGGLTRQQLASGALRVLAETDIQLEIEDTQGFCNSIGLEGLAYNGPDAGAFEFYAATIFSKQGTVGDGFVADVLGSARASTDPAISVQDAAATLVDLLLKQGRFDEELLSTNVWLYRLVLERISLTGNAAQRRKALAICETYLSKTEKHLQQQLFRTVALRCGMKVSVTIGSTPMGYVEQTLGRGVVVAEIRLDSNQPRYPNVRSYKTHEGSITFRFDSEGVLQEVDNNSSFDIKVTL